MRISLTIYILFLTTFCFGQINRQADWQQNVDYNIQVSLDDENHLLNAHIEMVYTNNSPDELNEIWIHLWPNAYKNNQTAFAKQQLRNNSTSFYFAKERKRGYIDSLAFTTANGDSLQLESHPEHIDIAKLILNQPLKSGESITISSPFRVKIPGSYSRMGHVRNSYQISQWYPKPAVYDVNGWNIMPYLDQGEFYSEFGTFEVAITLPSNYAVAATGELQDSAEMEWIAERILYYKGNTKRTEDEVASSALLKTLHYKQENIHDFAWFADKEFYIWESQQMLPDSSREIKTYVYSRSEYDENVIKYVNEGVEHYSEKVGNYPYQHATAVIGPLKSGGGMEYPMVTILSSTDRTTVVHEVGHNWFYGIIGTNERAHPWMDESINTYYENRHSQEKKYSSRGKDYLNRYSASQRFADGLSIVYANALARNKDQAVNLTSEEFTSSNYGGIIYGKGAYMFSLLQQHLGDSLFDAAMQNFYQEWKYKHPLPGDFRASIVQSTGDSLEWFFEDLLNTTKNYDYKISAIKFKNVSDEDLAAGKDNYLVKVKNTGKVAAPFQILTIDEDGSLIRSRWDSGFTGSRWISIPGRERLDTLTKESLRKKEAKRVNKRMGKVVQVALNLDNPLNELNIHDNRIKTSGILKKMEILTLKGANHLDRATTASITPLVNYNYYDRWMFGAALNNLAHWERRFHYYAAGFYSLAQNPLNYELYARQMFPINASWSNRLDIFGTMASFGHEANITPNAINNRSTYQRINLGAAVHFINGQKPYSRASRKLTVSFNQMNDQKERMSVEANGLDPIVYGQVIQARYDFKSNQKLNPLNYRVTVEQIDLPAVPNIAASSTQKVFGEITKVFHFSKMQNYLQVRAFAGLIFGDLASKIQYSFAASNGNNDYLFERNLLARNEGFNQIPNGVLGARVIDPNFAGFRAPAWIPTTGAVYATNLEYSFKRSIPFNVYLDLSYAPANSNSPFNTFNYVGGINMRIIKNVMEVSLPLVYSSDIANSMGAAGIKQSRNQTTNYNPFKNWHRLIVFKLNLNFSQDELIQMVGL